MRVYKTRSVEEEKVANVYCDICKQPIDQAYVDYDGWGKLTIEFGYPSAYDGNKYELDICDSCFEIFKGNIPLRRKEY